MKILIVDDERHVREAVKMLVNWAEHGIETILEAENGEIAASIVDEEQPELIMTDMMMPVRNGVDLLAWLQTHAPSSKKLVVSGHDDFDLVRSTMKYGGMDYILKPIDPRQLNEAIAKAIQAWDEEKRIKEIRQKRDIEINQLKPVYWDKLFSNLIAEPASYPKVKDELEREFGLSCGVCRSRIAVLDLQSIDPSLGAKYHKNWDLLFFTLSNIGNEFLRADNQGFACRHWNNAEEIVMFYWGEEDSFMSILTRMNEAFLSTLRTRFNFGVGREQAFPVGIRHSYQEAKAALRKRNLLDGNALIHEFNPSEAAGTGSLHLSELSERFRLSVVSSQPKEMEDAVDEWLRKVGQLSVVTPDMIEHWQQEFDVLCTQWVKQLLDASSDTEHAVEQSRDSRLPLGVDGCLSFKLWRGELVERLTRLSRAYVKHQQKDHNVIHDIVKYIELHYQKEITLQDIASHFYLSREHISRKFKQELGVNLSDFVAEIRVNKAKVLLKNPSLTIGQVAEMIGYADEKYFSKVFKKLVGMSPNLYRKS